MPLLVRWPGVAQPSSTSQTPAMIYDWFPTLLHVAGAAGVPNTDGLNLRTLFAEQTDSAFDRPLVWHFPNFWGPLKRPGPVEGPGMGPSSTIRHGDWKLIYYHTGGRFELFNLADDLGETTNLADHEPDRVRELARELSDILQKHRSPMPLVTATGRTVPLPVEVLNQ